MKTSYLFLGILLLLQVELTGQNLISNGDFEGGCTNWWSGAGGGGAATFTCPVTGAANVQSGSNALRANVTTAGAIAWDVQTIHSGFTATPGLIHSLTFWAKSSVAGRQMRVVIQNTTYAAQDYILTTNWTQYTFNFTPSEASLQLKIHYIQTGDFFFDGFTILDPSGGPAPITSTINPNTNFQNMIGFGGALTWYCDRVTSSPQKNALVDLIFSDLGIDIVRFKNWYYPVNYPTNKSTANMEPNWFKPHFDATNELYTLAKGKNSNIDVLLCSWSPPTAFKSNNALPEGTLRKSGGQFMYKEFAQYWVDILDRISFVPDYISIQNEPGYVNAGWETCEWRPTETTDFPGYDRALDSVYERIKNRTVVPKLLGPEPENLGSAGWNPALNTFRALATPVKPKPHLYGYAYHLYNYYASAANIAPGNLNIIRDEFGDKPNFMTEFGSVNYNWIDVGRMIHANLVEANTSAYIYWELIWDAGSNETMIAIDAAGNYTIRDLYYAVKHYAKYVDKGYTRIAVSGNNATLNLTAFKNPAGNQITVVAINNHTSAQPLNLALSSGSISSAAAYQSVAGNFWQNLGAVNLATTQTLPAKSLTTYVINTGTLPVTFTDFTASLQNESVLLKWSVTEESNIRKHNILRSKDPVSGNWDTLGFVPAVNQNGLYTYTFADSEIHAGEIYYYKIASEEFDSKIIYSKIVSLSIGDQNDFATIYPNPSNDEFHLQLSGVFDETLVTVYNSMGQKIHSDKVGIGEVYSFGKKFNSGVYFVEVNNLNRIKVYKVLKE